MRRILHHPKVVAVLVLIAALLGCSTQETTDFRTTDGIPTANDDENFIVQAPTAISGSYLRLNVKNARTRCQNKPIENGIYEVTCYAIGAEKGKELLPGGVEPGTTVVWNSPFQKGSGDAVGGSCTTTALSQTCRIFASGQDGFLTFGYEIKDATSNKTANFDVLLKYSISMTAGANLFMKTFQSSTTETNSNTNLLGVTETKKLGLFGFQSTKRDPIGYPTVVQSMCSSKAGLFYSAGSTIFRYGQGQEEIYTGSADGEEISMDSRHLFNMECSPTGGATCLEIACSDDGVYAANNFEKRVVFIPHEGQVKEIVGASSPIWTLVNNRVPEYRRLNLNKDGVLSAIRTIYTTVGAADYSLVEISATGELKNIAGGGLIKNDEQTDEVALAGYTATDLKFGFGVTAIPSNESGIYYVYERSAANGYIWKIVGDKAKIHAILGLRQLPGVQNVEDIYSPQRMLIGANDDLYLIGSRYVKNINAKNPVESLVLSSAELLNTAVWMNSEKTELAIYYGTQKLKRKKIDSTGAPILFAGTENTFTYSSIFKNGPRKANETSVGDPQALTILDDGSIMYVDRTFGSLMKIDNTGMLHYIAGSGTSLAKEGNVKDLLLLNDIGIGPYGLVVAKDGTILVADSGNHRVIAIKDGVYWTIAGELSGKYGACSTAAGLAKDSRLKSPSAMAVDEAGRVYIPDFYCHRVYVVSSYAKADDATRTVSVAFGGGTAQIPADGSAIDAKTAALINPSDIKFMKDGRAIIAEFAGSGTNTGRLLQASLVNDVWMVSKYAGGGTNLEKNFTGGASEVKLSNPSRLAVGEGKSMYFVDFNSYTIRKTSESNDSVTVEPIWGHLKQNLCGFGTMDGNGVASTFGDTLKSSLSTICQGIPVGVAIKESCDTNPEGNVIFAFSQRFAYFHSKDSRRLADRKGVVLPAGMSPIWETTQNGGYIIKVEWPCAAAQASGQ